MDTIGKDCWNIIYDYKSQLERKRRVLPSFIYNNLTDKCIKRQNIIELNRKNKRRKKKGMI